MDTLSIIASIVALAAIGGLAWLGGYELGMASGISSERELSNRRLNLEELNTRKPKSAKCRRKAQRRAAK